MTVFSVKQIYLRLNTVNNISLFIQRYISKIEAMDSQLFSSKNRSTLSMPGSKLFTQEGYLGNSELNFQDQLYHVNCLCYHCINNTKPIPQPVYPRIKDQDQFHLEDNQAYVFIIERLTEFLGSLKIPDIFIAHNSSIAYLSSQTNQIKIKYNVTLTEIKKHFDVRKIQYIKILKSQINEWSCKKQNTSKHSNNIQIRQSRNQSSLSQLRKDKQMRQFAFVNYNTISSQLVTESSLSKYLSKRKNDSFWQEISSISLIPPYRQDQLRFHSYFYQRTEGNVQEMGKQLERVSRMVDQDDKLKERAELLGSAISQTSQVGFDKSTSNYQGLVSSKLGISLAKGSYLMNKSSFDRVQFSEVQEMQIMANISKEIIAYLEVKLHIRISSCVFKFVIDHQGTFYFTSVQKFIAANLKNNQLKIVHDRYTNLQIDDSKQIMKIKAQLQHKKQMILQNSLADLVVECLQKRKTQLKIRQSNKTSLTQVCVYQRPSNQSLIQMFKKIFPTFNQEELFTNSNWQNEFKIYICSCRNRINKVIRQDEGIRILKRFGIIFYRTWD